MPQQDGLIVLSGGMDSVTLLYEYQANIALAISFDYGSKHNAQEIPYARLHCERLGIEHLTIPLGFMGQYFRSALLQGGGEIPKGSYDEENMAATVVPFRNGIMLSIAAGLAESRGLKHVYIANHFGDHAIYPRLPCLLHPPDARGYRSRYEQGVEVTAPYTDISKGEIARYGKALGINYAETWSCYEGGAVQCGQCGTCIERREAMLEAGIEDPTTYKD